jgi:hypothetical protein
MAPSSITQDQTSPLLAPKLVNTQPISPLSKSTSTAIHTLAILRIGIGAASLIAPRWTFGLFQVAVPQASSTIVRLYGVRDVILGELLYTAEDKRAPDGGRREIKRALWSNIAADAVDICSVGFAVATGSMGRLPGALVVGGAALGVGLGALGLRGL